jgi:hypothetical protein
MYREDDAIATAYSFVPLVVVLVVFVRMLGA